VKVIKTFDDDEPQQLLHTHDVGETFGETAILVRLNKGHSIFGSYQAEGACEVYQMELDMVLKMCEADAGLSERLNRILALRLARRLRNLNSQKGRAGLIKQDSATNNSTTSRYTASSTEQQQVTDDEDQKFCKKFGLPQGEVILTAYDCSLKQTVVSHGTLFVSPNYLAYGAVVFGLKKKEVIPLLKIREIERKDEKYIEV
jgi:CRP-like cAMP-binding protein